VGAKQHDDRAAEDGEVELSLLAWADDESGEQQAAPEARPSVEDGESASIPARGRVPAVSETAQSQGPESEVTELELPAGVDEDGEEAEAQPDFLSLLGAEADADVKVATEAHHHHISRPMVAAAAFSGLALVGLSAVLAQMGGPGSPPRAPVSGAGIFPRPTLGAGLALGPALLTSPAATTPPPAPKPSPSTAVHHAPTHGTTSGGQNSGSNSSGSAGSAGGSGSSHSSVPSSPTTTKAAAPSTPATTQTTQGPTDISGSITCESQNVEGVWIQAANGGSGWAPWVSSADDATYATYSYTLPHGGAYSLHVGCGGTTSSWAVAAYSSFYGGTVNNFFCYDQSSDAQYAVCDRTS
jgi:hypothetical protein